MRTLALRPESNWGGEGILGCDVVQGYLHGIPARRKSAWLPDSETAHLQSKPAHSSDDLWNVEAKGATNLEDVEDEADEVLPEEASRPAITLSKEKEGFMCVAPKSDSSDM